MCKMLLKGRFKVLENRSRFVLLVSSSISYLSLNRIVFCSLTMQKIDVKSILWSCRQIFDCALFPVVERCAQQYAITTIPPSTVPRYPIALLPDF